VTDTRARLDDLELRVSALEADSERARVAQEASRAEREASRDHIDFTKAMVLELGQRVGKLERVVASLERRFDTTDEMDRLRHAEVMRALEIAARDSEAKGARLAEGEAGLARAWRLWGWQTTVIVVATAVLNLIGNNVWRIWYEPGRSRPVPQRGEGAPVPVSSHRAVPGAGADR
jgi:BMFP domain-containing protein YqiC